MKNLQIKCLIAGVAIFAGLAALWLRLGSLDPLSQAQEEDLPGLVVYETGQTVENIAVFNSTGAYDIRLVTAADGRQSYRVAQYGDDVPLYAGRLSALGRGASDLLAYHRYEQVDDLAQYGLEQPAAHGVVTFADGTRTTLFIGSLSPDGANVYLRAEGDHLMADSAAVYLAPLSSIDYILLGATDLISPLITPAAPIGAPFDRVSFSGASRAADPFAVLRQAPRDADSANTYTVSARQEWDLNPYSGMTTLQMLFSLTADGAVALYPDQGQLEQYGLLPPYSSVEVLGEESFALHASEPDEEGLCYLYREGNPVVYRVYASKLPWLELTFYDLYSPHLYSPAIDRVDRVDITVGDETHTIQFTHHENADPLAALDGDPIAMDVIRPYYKTLISATSEGYLYEPAVGAMPPEFSTSVQSLRPSASIVFHYREGGTNSIEFYQGGAYTVYLGLDGDPPIFTATAAYMNRVGADLNLLLAGRAVEAWS